MRRGLCSLLFVLLLVSPFTVFLGIANASGAYIGLSRSTSTVLLKASSSDSGIDVASYWYDLIQGSTCDSASKTELDSAMGSGEWGVSLYTGNIGYGADAHTETYAFVYWTDGTDGYNRFAGVASNDYIQNIPGATPHREALLYVRDDDSPGTPIHVDCQYNVNTIIGSRSHYTPGFTFSFDAQIYLSTFNTIYPLDYEGEPLPIESPPAKYVAMGDSYSSIEGNPPFEYGTDVDNENGCHRSLQAYPQLLQNRLNLGPTAFVACSGATTGEVISGKYNESSQLSTLSSSTAVVTIIIGGNDAGMSDYVLGCTIACGPGSLTYNAMITGINAPAFKANLITVYEQILDKAPAAQLFVGDYPYLSAENATVCEGLDFSGARSIQVALNTIISEAVGVVKSSNPRIHMVQTNFSGSPFKGRYLCNGGDSYFHGLHGLPNTEYSFHPNLEGSQAYAMIFADAIG